MTHLLYSKGDSGQLGYGNPYGEDMEELFTTCMDIYDPPCIASPPEAAIDVGINTVRQVSAGQKHTCAVLNDNSLTCWGKGEFGRLGIGNDYDQYIPPIGAIDLGAGAIQVSAGEHHNCAILDDGTLKCWGMVRV